MSENNLADAGGVPAPLTPDPPPMHLVTEPNGFRGGSKGTVVAGVLAFLGALVASYRVNSPLGMWALALGGLVALLISLGWYRCRRVWGVLINDRYVMSLSRLQMVLWTMLVLSAFTVGVFIRLKGGMEADALGLQVDPQLWTLLGINTAALVGTPFILSVRSNKPMTDDEKKEAAQDAARTFVATEQPKADADTVATKAAALALQIAENATGPVYANATPADAALTDIFEGDELANTHVVDLAKVQMFFFTTIAALVWVVVFAETIHGYNMGSQLDALKLKELPNLPEGMLALLGFSNSAYLANKGIDHTK